MVDTAERSMPKSEADRANIIATRYMTNAVEVAEEMTFFARAGDDEKVLELLRRAVPNYPVVESGTMPEAL